MREIKFRIWDKVKHKLSYQEKGWCGSNGFISIAEIYTGYEDSDEWKNYEVMQFTGLKDKNGKEIYEGDIVAFYDELKMEKTHISKIIFNQEKSRFDKELLKKYFGESEKNGISSNWATVVEVIGNVYENKELLKETI